MSVVLVSSPTPGSGKTAAIVALGQRLRRLGIRVRYRRLPGSGASADADFVASTLRLDRASAGAPSTVDRTGAENGTDDQVTFLEAGDETDLGASSSIVASVDIHLIVARFQSDRLVEAIVQRARQLNVRGSLVLINAVPDKGMRLVQNRIVPALQDAGLAVLAIIPQDRILLGLSVGELASSLGADVLCADDQLALPVEAVMISAMSDEGAEAYFRRVARKAVVAGGDRPDIHMPALATDTSCIVLTEGHDPDPTVFKTAEEQGVPLLKVRPSTIETLEHVSDALAGARFRQAHKVSRAVALFGAQIDDDSLRHLLRDGEEEAKK
jgi:BioD-like phosphotransacetylase family protein